MNEHMKIVKVEFFYDLGGLLMGILLSWMVLPPTSQVPIPLLNLNYFLYSCHPGYVKVPFAFFILYIYIYIYIYIYFSIFIILKLLYFIKINLLKNILIIIIYIKI